MKQVFPTSLLLLLSLIFSPAASGQEVIAFWNFNDGFTFPDETAQITHNALLGSGVIYQQRADTDGNGKGGNPYANALLGIDSPDGRSIAWDDVAKSGDNDAELFATFSTNGFRDIVISFDAQGNADGGIASYDIKYDNNPLEDTDFEGNTIKDFAGGISLFWDDVLDDGVDAGNDANLPTLPEDFSRFTIDFSSITAANDQSFFAVRFDDIEDNDDFRLTNFLVTGTPIAVPEPSALVVTLSGCFATLLRRRRSY